VTTTLMQQIPEMIRVRLMLFRWAVTRRREKLLTYVAWHLPESVAYWTAIRVMTNDCDGNPAEQPCIEALQRWSESHS
jgi:hypothetical protein